MKLFLCCENWIVGIVIDCDCVCGSSVRQSEYLCVCVSVCLCSDVDECLIIPGSCGNGTCQNIPGRYKCLCDRGFEDPMNMQMCMGEIFVRTSQLM